MFKPIVTKYLSEMKYKQWSIISHKLTLSELSIQYLTKHISVNVNGQCVVMKTDQVDTIPEEIRSWLVTALTVNNIYLI